MNLQTQESVRHLQRELARKSKSEPKYRFYSLYDKVYRMGKSGILQRRECAGSYGGGKDEADRAGRTLPANFYTASWDCSATMESSSTAWSERNGEELSANVLGKPCVGNPQARFDEKTLET